MPPLAALFAWPAVVSVLFARQTVSVAVITGILGGYLLLPENTSVNLPLLPSLDKNTVPAVTVMVLALLIVSNRRGGAGPEVQPGLMPQSWMARGLLALIVLGSFMTALTNADPVSYGPITLPGLRIYDSFSMGLASLMAVLPLLASRKFLARGQENLLLLKGLTIAGLAYSLLALFEIRMSPQMNNMVYGFFPHSWIQHVRDGGYRPLVFLSHGLWLAIFFSGTILAAFCLGRLKGRLARAFTFGGLWLLMTLVLSKSLGALVITLVLLPVVLLLGRRGQIWTAAVLAGVVLTYPLLRSNDLVPVQAIISKVESFSLERASSLNTRVENENAMLAKAQQKPLFGWGGWGRSRVTDADGTDTSIADGYWVILIGVSGWVGYIAVFGLLTGPILILAARPGRIGLETTCVALVLTGNLVDMLPNATITPVTWLLAGALWGRLETRGDPQSDAVPDPAAVSDVAGGQGSRPALDGMGQPRSPYTRQSHPIRRNVTGRTDHES